MKFELIQLFKFDCLEMAQRWGRWIPNPEVVGSKPLGGSDVNSACHPSEID